MMIKIIIIIITRVTWKHFFLLAFQLGQSFAVPADQELDQPYDHDHDGGSGSVDGHDYGCDE